MKIPHPYGVPTCANTKLMPWWQKLNKELAKLDLPEADFGTARGYYETGHTPGTAAYDIKVMSEDDGDAMGRMMGRNK